MIAAFYSDAIHWNWLVIAILIFAAMVGMRRWFASPWAYVVPAVAAWFAVLESGVHATIAGVVLGLLTPATPVRGRPVLDQLEHRYRRSFASQWDFVRFGQEQNLGIDLGSVRESPPALPLAA